MIPKALNWKEDWSRLESVMDRGITAMDDAFPQKRKFPRIPAENAVLVRKVGEAPIEGFATMKTVGLGGCMFVQEAPLGSGSVVEILISIKSWVVKATGKVVYEIPKEDTTIEVGVEFIDISPADKAVLETLFLPIDGGVWHP